MSVARRILGSIVGAATPPPPSTEPEVIQQRVQAPVDGTQSQKTFVLDQPTEAGSCLWIGFCQSGTSRNLIGVTDDQGGTTGDWNIWEYISDRAANIAWRLGVPAGITSVTLFFNNNAGSAGVNNGVIFEIRNAVNVYNGAHTGRFVGGNRFHSFSNDHNPGGNIGIKTPAGSLVVGCGQFNNRIQTVVHELGYTIYPENYVTSAQQAFGISQYHNRPLSAYQCHWREDPSRDDWFQATIAAIDSGEQAMNVGNEMTGVNALNTIRFFPHQYSSVFMPISGKWICCGWGDGVAGSTDHLLWEKPAIGPSGSGADWPAVVLQGTSTQAIVHDTASTFPLLAQHSTDEIHMFIARSTPEYKKATIDSNNELTWDIGDNTNTEVIPDVSGISDAGNFALIVDSLGRPWIGWVFATTSNAVSVKGRDLSTGWAANVQITTYPTFNRNSMAFCSYVHTDGSPGIACACISAARDIRILYRLDSQPLTDPWVELGTLDFSSETGDLNRHMAVRSMVLPGDTASTFFLTWASNFDVVYVARVKIGAGPVLNADPVIEHHTQRTGKRPKIVLDETNYLWRVFWQSNDQNYAIFVAEYDAQVALTNRMAPNRMWIEQAASVDGGQSVDCAEHNCNAATGWFLRGDRDNGSSIWWNEEGIT